MGDQGSKTWIAMERFKVGVDVDAEGLVRPQPVVHRVVQERQCLHTVALDRSQTPEIVG